MADVKQDSPETAREALEKARAVIASVPYLYQKVRIINGAIELYERAGHVHCLNAMRLLLVEVAGIVNAAEAQEMLAAERAARDAADED